MVSEQIQDALLAFSQGSCLICMIIRVMEVNYPEQWEEIKPWSYMHKYA